MSPVKLTVTRKESSVSSLWGMVPASSGRSGCDNRGAWGSHSAAAAGTAHTSSCKTARKAARRRFISVPLSPGVFPIDTPILTGFPPKGKEKISREIRTGRRKAPPPRRKQGIMFWPPPRRCKHPEYVQTEDFPHSGRSRPPGRRRGPRP